MVQVVDRNARLDEQVTDPLVSLVRLPLAHQRQRVLLLRLQGKDVFGEAFAQPPPATKVTVGISSDGRAFARAESAYSWHA